MYIIVMDISTVLILNYSSGRMASAGENEHLRSPARSASRETSKELGDHTISDYREISTRDINFRGAVADH